MFVYDQPWFPFEDFVDWDSFSVRVHESDINRLEEILDSYGEARISEMRGRLRSVWFDNFTMSSVYENLIKMMSKQ